jgi:hypothetical protein
LDPLEAVVILLVPAGAANEIIFAFTSSMVEGVFFAVLTIA